MHHYLEILTSNPLKHKMDYPMLIVSICLGKSIRINRVKVAISAPTSILLIKEKKKSEIGESIFHEDKLVIVSLILATLMLQ